MKKLNYAFGVIAVLAIMVASTIYINDKNGNNLSLFTPGVRITKAGEAAFGELANLTAASGRGSGGGGGGSEAAAPASDAKSTDSLTIAPPGYGGGGGGEIYISTNYKYVYNGEALDLSLAKREVLKKQKADNFSMQGLLDSLNFGLINLGSFGNTKLQSASFLQEGTNGYFISVDTLNGTISMSGNWPQPLAVDSHACSKDSDAGRTDCSYPQPQPVKISDIPADEELINIANAFVAQHSISLAAYGAPEVVDDYRVMYERAANKSLVYLPESISVLYPLLLNGQNVFDEGGNKSGLMIGIHIRNKQVVSMWDLSLQNYTASDYDSETNADRIMKLVAQGGMYGYSDPNAQRTVEIKLGEPKIEFVRMWNYQNNASEELLVPSLVFPVLEQPAADQYFYRKAVVIPLIKQILDRYPGVDGPVKILPSPMAQ